MHQPSDLLEHVQPDSFNAEKAESAACRLFSLSLDLLAVASLKTGRWLQVNPAMTHSLGWSEREFLETPIADFVHPDDLDHSTEAVQKLAQGEPLAGFEQRIRCRDGSYRIIEWRTVSSREDSLLYCVGRDVTERERIEDETAAELADSRRLQEISCRLIPTGDVSQLHEELLTAAVEITHADRGSIQSIDQATGELKLLRTRNIPDELLQAYATVEAGAGTSCARALADGQRAIVDFAAEPWASTDVGRIHLAAGIRIAQSTPLVSRSGRTLGMLSTHWSTDHRPAEREMRLLDVLARQAADLLERHQTDQALRQSEHRLAVEVAAMNDLHATAQRLLDAPNEPAAFTELLDAVIRVQGADMGNVQVLNRLTGTLDIFAQRGFDPALLEPYMSLPADDDETVCGRANIAGERLIIEDVMTDDAYAAHRGLAVAADFRAVQSTPLISRTGEMLGIVSTHFRQPHRPSEEALRLTDLHVGYAAEVITRMRALEALRQSRDELEQRVSDRTSELELQTARLRSLALELAAAEHRERKRLAALLHDDLQQLLVAAKMRLVAARQQSTPDAIGRLRAVDEMIDSAVEASRDLTRQLRPPVLYEDGLAAALDWLAEHSQQTHGLKVKLEAQEGDLPLSDDVRALLFESVRELLFNIVKHAKVDKAIVKLTHDHRRVKIIVEDRGVGIPEGDEHRSGVGLFSIRERLTALGGKLIVNNLPQGGTRVHLYLPFLGVRPPLIRRDGVGDASSAVVVSHDTAAAMLENRRRVLVVDDHALVRQGLASTLLTDDRIQVVGEAADGLEALEAIERHRPHVVLMDVNMPRMNGVDATREIRRRWPSIKVVALSVQDDEATARTMLNTGAAAFISKSDDASRMIGVVMADAVASESASAS